MTEIMIFLFIILLYIPIVEMLKDILSNRAKKKDILMDLVRICIVGFMMYGMIQLANYTENDRPVAYNDNKYFNESNNNSYSSDIQHVEPDNVQGYYRDDGTYVRGYHRGGDDGYWRSNPD